MPSVIPVIHESPLEQWVADVEAHDPAVASTAPDPWDAIPSLPDPSDFLSEPYDPDHADHSDPPSMATPLGDDPPPPLPPPSTTSSLPPFLMRPHTPSLYPDRPWRCLLR